MQHGKRSGHLTGETAGSRGERGGDRKDASTVFPQSHEAGYIIHVKAWSKRTGFWDNRRPGRLEVSSPGFEPVIRHLDMAQPNFGPVCQSA